MDKAGSSACPSLADLEASLDGEYPSAAVQRHLAECAQCRQKLARIRDNNHFLRSLKPVLPEAPASPPSAQEAAPETDLVRGYAMLRELHRGGQGVVYEAVQTATKRKVAIKVLTHRSDISGRQLRRFEREVEVIAGLRHPHIVTIYDSGTTIDGRHYFAMELVVGETLDAYLGRHRLELRDKVRLMAKVAQAVQHAHQRGVIHRDLKPGNVLVDAAGEPHVVDFGVAKLTSATALGDPVLSLTGEFVGTLSYAAPEQVSGDPDQIDMRTDVYGLGVVLYEALTGRLPYLACGSISDIVHTIVDTEPTRPSQHNRVIDDELETVVLKALAKEPARRYQSAGTLAEDLERYLGGLPISAKRDSTWYILRKTAGRYRLHVSIAAIGVLFLTVFAIFMTLERGRAVRAEELADTRADELARALHEGNIERGRALAAAGDIPHAEELLWQEFLLGRADPETLADSAAPGVPTAAPAYWALWELHARSGCRAILPGHRLGTRVSFAPGSNHAYWTVDGSLYRWQADHGRYGVVVDFGQPLRILALSPNGHQVLALDASGALTLRDIASGAAVVTLASNVAAGAFAPDAACVAIGSLTGAVWLRDAATGHEQPIFAGDGDRVVSIGCGRAGAPLAWSAGRYVRVWDQGRLHEWQIPLENWNNMPAAALVFDDYGLAFAYGNHVWRWEQPYGDPPKTWISEGGGGRIINAVLNRNARLLTAGGYDRKIRLWDAQTGEQLRTLAGHSSPLGMTSLNPDASLLASDSSDGTVRIWDIRPTPGRTTLTGHTDTVHGLCLTPDGRTVISAAGALDPTVRLWNLGSRQEVRVLRTGHTDVVAAVACSADAKLFATASYDGSVKLWDSSNLQLVQLFAGPSGRASALAFHPTAPLLATGGYDSAVRLWDITTGQSAGVLTDHRDRIPQICFTPDGRTLASASMDGTVILWDVASRQARRTRDAHEAGVRAVAVSPVGDLIATGSDDTTIRVWDSATGVCKRVMSGYSQDTFALAFHPSGELLASGARDGQIMLWDVETGRNLLVLQEAVQHSLFGLLFTPDGQTLVSSGMDQSIHLWDLSYYQRHIAGCMEHYLGRFAREMAAAGVDPQPFRDWSRSVLDPSESPNAD